MPRVKRLRASAILLATLTATPSWLRPHAVRWTSGLASSANARPNYQWRLRPR